MSLFEPTSIAVIGASADEGSVGHDILKNLLTQGYEGDVYPINPKHDEILGVNTYASVNDIDADVELAIIVVPAKIVPVVLKECGEKKIVNATIISAGFAETHTDEGVALEEQIKEIANEYSINVIGPNCLGILRPSIKMNASFAAANPPEGNVAFISQSGAMAVAVMDASQELGIGYSLVASIGNKAVMNESDLLEHALSDDKTTVIGFYLESITDGKRFLDICTKATQTKHVVILKAGTSKQGKKAASSHTGALAGNDAGIDALCAQSGALRAHTLEEFCDLLEALSSQPPLASPNIAVITNAGGPGILATDAAERAGLTLPKLSEKIEAALREHLPQAASTGNPIDVVGDADLKRYQAALDAAGDDPNIDGVAALLTPQVMTPVEDIAHALIEWKKLHPTMPLVTSFMGEEHVQSARLALQKSDIPALETPERAIAVLGALKQERRSQKSESTIDLQRSENAQKIIANQTGLLPEETIAELLSLYAIPTPIQRLATNDDEAVSLANSIGYPVVAKISSPDILHKTDIGGIRADLQNEEDVRSAWNTIIQNAKAHKPDADIRGILIQEFLPAGHEFIVGAIEDSAFGHLVMAGLGGIYTETLSDAAFRIAPVSQEESYRLLQDLHSWKVLLGTRGQKQSDIDALAQLIQSVSQLVAECPQISDIDFNPVFVTDAKVVVADAKVIMRHIDK